MTTKTKTAKRSSKKTIAPAKAKKAALAKKGGGGDRDQLEDVRAAALEHEGAARWGEAAEAWDAIATSKGASKKQRADAAGRAAAAHVRAGAGDQVDGPGAADDVDVAPEAAEDEGDAAPGPVAASTPAPAKERDQRLPPAGTELEKRRGGAVVATAIVQEDGALLYNGTCYKTPSAAAMACVKALGLTTKATNGWTFWGITKKPGGKGGGRAAADPAVAMEAAWSRYQERAEKLIEGAAPEHRDALREQLEAHAARLRELAGRVVSGS